jgi:microcystin-dependent protein
VPTTVIEGSKYRIKVNVYDGAEWSGYSSEYTVRARWGLSHHQKDVTISAAAPTSWLVSILDTTAGATSSVTIEYNSSSDGSTLPDAWQADLAAVTKRTHVHYRAWMTAWGASPATSPSVNEVKIIASGFTAQPDFWLPSPISGNGGSIAIDTHAFGTQSLRIDGNGTARVITQTVSLDPHTDYVLQARKRSIGDSGAAVYLTVSGAVVGPVLDQAGGTACHSTLDWDRYTSAYFNSGEATSAVVSCAVDGLAGTTGFFDGIKLERGRVASSWVPGFVGDAAVIDAGGVQIDASAGGVLRLRGSGGLSTDVTVLGVHGLEGPGLGGPIGQMVMWPTASAPTSHLICDGSSLLRAGTYADLFAVIGTTFGAADGTHFSLPDMRGRFPLGVNAGSPALAGTGGSFNHTHTGPSHTHTGPSHSHTMANHTHTMGNHTHTMANHVHSGPSHTHPVSGTHQHSTALANTGMIRGNPYGSGATFTSTQSSTASSISDSRTATLTNAVSSGTTDAAGTGNTGGASSNTSDGPSTNTSDGPSNNTSDAAGTGATGADGTGATGSNNPPYLGINFIIKYA